MAQKVVLKKSVAERVKWLNENGGLLSELRLGAVAGVLAKLEQEEALDVLDGLLAQAAELDDPTAWVKETARSMLPEQAAAKPVPAANGKLSGAGVEALPPKKRRRKDQAKEENGGSAVPASDEPATIIVRGDWTCMACGEFNSKETTNCENCGVAKRVEWNCASCNSRNFPDRTTCRRCNEPKPGGTDEGCAKKKGARKGNAGGADW